MKLLVVDSIYAAGETIARDLTKALGHCTLYCSSSDEAYDRLKSERDALGVVVFFLEESPETGLVFVRKVLEFCSIAAIRCPRFLVLTSGNLLGYRRRFRALGAHCILYGYPEELYASVREMVFEVVYEKNLPTIIVDRSGHKTGFWLLGPAGRELITIGPRQRRLMNFVAVNHGVELSTADLAEAIDATLVSIRVYLDRLRERFNEAAQKVGVLIAGKDVFCTFRKDGSFVHLLRARVLFI